MGVALLPFEHPGVVDLDGQPFQPDHEPRVLLYPRNYQRKDDDESFRLWDTGEKGVLTRAFTGSGKTAMACLKARRWLARGPDYRVMIVSYERDLVWQFAQEVDDFLGITPGIEMAENHVAEIPQVVVACRQSLLPAQPATQHQLEGLARLNLEEAAPLSAKVLGRLMRALARGADVCEARDEIARLLEDVPEARGSWSRLHKFDWRLNWLVFFDEAHRHAYSLKSVGHMVDWFDQNPHSRRGGLTATPKRGDGISIGHRMFPGIALDFPLFHLTRPCGVKEGWAVPYLQRYIEVEGVDFRRLKQVAGDYDEADLERMLGDEATLAKLIEPLLDMVGDRRTLVFCPGVQMAADVAAYINARCEAECPACQSRKWYPAKLLGDGAQCKCGTLIDAAHVTKGGEQAKSIHGGTTEHDRKSVYVGHQGGKFQFLSVCGLCREGYNDPDISCVAVFRPVSKKASSLAEQMKGRGCRPCRAIVPVLNELLTAEERVEAIAQSNKPNCLVVDLVGITGLADCASTVQIYAEGLDDEVSDRAAELLAEKGAGEDEADVEDAIRQAQREIDEERARVKAAQEEVQRRRLEEAQMRAKAAAEVTYTAHEMGVGGGKANHASEGQMRFITLLGIKLRSPVSTRKARRMIDMLKERVPPSEVAYQNGIPAEQWEAVGPTDNQIWRLGRLGVSPDAARSGYEASQIIGAALNPSEFEQKKMQEIHASATGGQLSAVAHDLALAKRVLSAEAYGRLVAAGKAKRAALV